MFKTLLFSLKKSKILAKIRTESETPFNTHEVVGSVIKEITSHNTMSNKQFYFEKLLALLKTDLQTINILQKYNRNFDDLRRIVNVLERTGAGKIVKGHYVAISAIAFVSQLRAILQYWNGENFLIEDLDSFNSNLKMTNYLISSFG